MAMESACVRKELVLGLVPPQLYNFKENYSLHTLSFDDFTTGHKYRKYSVSQSGIAVLPNPTFIGRVRPRLTNYE